MGKKEMKKMKGTNRKLMKVFFGATIAAIVIVSAFAILPSGTNPLSDETVVSVDPSSQNVSIGETFTVNITVNPAIPIHFVGFDLSFNSSLINAVDVTEGNLFAGHGTLFPPVTIDNTAGTITNVYGVIMGAGNVSSNGTFVVITFTASTASGTSHLELYDVSVQNETGNVPITVNNGSVTIVQEPNDPPVFSGETPSDGSTVPISTSSLSVIIEDPEGDNFNWNIETSPNVGSGSNTGDSNGTKTCGISGLDYFTTYTWWVNATDPAGSGEWTREIYTFNTESVSPAIVYVNDDFNNSTPGWHVNKWAVIQKAIDNSSNGYTIYVYNGTYYENVVVDKSINLTGENRDTTVIDGGGSGDVVYVTADGVNISGFAMINSGSYYYAGITVLSDNNILKNNTISNNYYAIWLKCSDNNSISENIVSNNSVEGIWLNNSCCNEIFRNTISNHTSDSIFLMNLSNNNIVSENTILNSGCSGIRLYYSYYNIISENKLSNDNHAVFLNHFSNENTFSENIISNNSIGVLQYTSCNNLFLRNTISFNNHSGILLAHSSDNIFSGNNISANNEDGIGLDNSSSNVFFGNAISSNSFRGIWIHETHGASNNNTIYHNNFINNTQNAYDECNNTWDNGYPSGGNYWDDYTGSDLYHGSNQDIPGSDGIGDTPYNISGGSNQDLYPLMNPWVDNQPPEITNMQANPPIQEIGKWVNITCNVTDNVGIDVAKVNITHPNGNITNVTMTNIVGTDNYYYNTTYSMLGNYSYFVWANDTSNNSNTSTTYNFTITSGTTVSMDDVDIPEGGSKNVPIMINNVANVGACDVNLSWDPSVVSVTGVVGSDFDSVISAFDYVSGSARFGAFQMFSPGLDGYVVAVNLTFQAIGSVCNSCDLNITDSELLTAEATPSEIPHTRINGTVHIYAVNIPPVPDFTYSPTNPDVNQTVTFNANSSYDSDGNITSYEWDWDDDGAYDDTGMIATHSWSSNGSYPVTLRVTDNNGASDTKIKLITIGITKIILYGDEYYASSGDVREDNIYERGVLLSKGNQGGSVAYTLTVEGNVTVIEVGIRYTDNSWFGDGPKIALWNYNTSKWVYSDDLGKGTDVLRSGGCWNPEYYISPFGRIYISVTAGGLDATHLASIHIHIIRPQIKLDMLIVTNQNKLHKEFGGGAQTLLNKVSDIADNQNGTILFTDGYNTPLEIQQLIKQRAEEMEGLKYLMIVGGEDIIPFWQLDDPTKDDDYILSDYYYGDLDDDQKVDLAVGRIVGDEIGDMISLLSTSEISENNYHATVSGDDFMVDDVKRVEEILTNAGFSVDGLYGLWNAALPWHIQDKSIIFHEGHADWYIWGSHYGIPYLFALEVQLAGLGNTYPIVHTIGCHAGKIRNWMGDWSSIPLAFIDEGAVAYIGGTGYQYGCSSGEGWSETLARYFIQELLENKSTGVALKNAKIKFTNTIWNGLENPYCRKIVLQHILYGNPKYKLDDQLIIPLNKSVVLNYSFSPGLIMVCDSAGSNVYGMNAIINISNYNITEIDGHDLISIPGEGFMCGENGYVLPSISTMIPLPGNSEVYSVNMTSYNKTKLPGTYDLPLWETNIIGENNPFTPSSFNSSGSLYTVSSIENPNGTKTIVIQISPVEYDPDTGEAYLYTNFNFNIKYLRSTLQISDLSFDKLQYEPRENISISTNIINTGFFNLSNLHLDTTIGGRNLTTNVTIGFSVMAGSDSSGQIWNGSFEEGGYYFVEAVLKDSLNHTLDIKNRIIRVVEEPNITISMVFLEQNRNITEMVEVNRPFNLTVAVDNTGDYNATNVTATIDLPQGIFSQGNMSKQINDGIISGFNSKIVKWNLSVEQPGNYTIPINISSSNAGMCSLTYNLSIFPVKIDYPIGGEIIGGIIPLRWTATDGILKIKLEYYDGEWHIIATDEENDGEYDWDATDLSPGSDYKIRVTAIDGYENNDTSDAFSITSLDVTPHRTFSFNETVTLNVDGCSGRVILNYPIDDEPWGIGSYGEKEYRDGSSGTARFSNVRFNTTGHWVIHDEDGDEVFYLLVKPIELTVTVDPSEIDFAKGKWQNFDGTVMKPDGTPANGALVEIWPPGETPSGNAIPGVSATVDSDGNYTLVDVSIGGYGAGIYNITATIPNGYDPDADALGFTTVTVNPVEIDDNVTLYKMEDVKGGFRTGEIVFNITYPDGDALLTDVVAYNVSVWKGNEIYAWFNTSGPNNEEKMEFMVPAGTHYLNLSVSDPAMWETGSYTLKVQADRAGSIDWEYTGEESFNINDTTLPEISNVQDYPDPQKSGGWINISADVTDNVEVDEIYLNITHPDGSYENFSIKQNKTENTYYCNRTYDQIGTYNYFIMANDTSGNENQSTTHTFLIIPPVITFVNITPQSQFVSAGETFTVNITIDPWEPIAGAQADLLFDPSLITVNSVTDGGMFDMWFNANLEIDNVNGAVRNISAIDFGSVTTPGVFAVVEFTAGSIGGTSPLNLTNVIVGNPNGTAVSIMVNNGNVTVIPYPDWDVNMDDSVNILDLIIVGQHWGETGTPGWIRADVNKDGVINILDLILIGQHWTG